MSRLVEVRPTPRKKHTFPFYVDSSIALRVVAEMERSARPRFLSADTASFETRLQGSVVGYSTETLREAGGSSVRIQFSQSGCRHPRPVGEGAYTVAIRQLPSPLPAGEPRDSELPTGWLFGLAAVPMHCSARAEVAVFGTPCDDSKSLGCIEESTLQLLFSKESTVELCFLERLRRFEPVVCTGGPWLRDRLCSLAAQVNDMKYAEDNGTRAFLDPDVKRMLRSAGIVVSIPRLSKL